MKKFKELLIKLRACKDAMQWAGDMTIEEVIEKCHRGDWMLWLAAKIEIDERRLALTKGHCANTVRHLMKDERCIAAVDAAIAYSEGSITKEKLDDTAASAASAASAAAYAAYAATAATAADYAAANAANAAAAAANASAAAYASASAADYAAANAAAYAATAAYADAKKANQLQTADICRKYIGKEIIEKVNEILTN